MAQVTESLINEWLAAIGAKRKPAFTLNEFAQLCHAWSRLQRCREIMECNDPGNARAIFGPPASALETAQRMSSLTEDLAYRIDEDGIYHCATVNDLRAEIQRLRSQIAFAAPKTGVCKWCKQGVAADRNGNHWPHGIHADWYPCSAVETCECCTPERKCPDHGACVTDGQV